MHFFEGKLIMNIQEELARLKGVPYIPEVEPAPAREPRDQYEQNRRSEGNNGQYGFGQERTNCAAWRQRRGLPMCKLLWWF